MTDPDSLGGGDGGVNKEEGGERTWIENVRDWENFTALIFMQDNGEGELQYKGGRPQGSSPRSATGYF